MSTELKGKMVDAVAKEILDAVEKRFRRPFSGTVKQNAFIDAWVKQNYPDYDLENDPEMLNDLIGIESENREFGIHF